MHVKGRFRRFLGLAQLRDTALHFYNFRSKRASRLLPYLIVINARGCTQRPIRGAREPRPQSRRSTTEAPWRFGCPDLHRARRLRATQRPASQTRQDEPAVLHSTTAVQIRPPGWGRQCSPSTPSYSARTLRRRDARPESAWRAPRQRWQPQRRSGKVRGPALLSKLAEALKLPPGIPRGRLRRRRNQARSKKETQAPAGRNHDARKKKR